MQENPSSYQKAAEYYRAAYKLASILSRNRESYYLQPLIDKMWGGIIVREAILQGIDEGCDEFSNTPYMETVDKDYKDAFNLGYTLEQAGGKEYDTFMKLYEMSPTFKDTDTFKAIEAGRQQAIKEREEQLSQQYREDLVNKFAENRMDLTVDTLHNFLERERQKQKPYAEENLNRKQGPTIELSKEQQKELRQFEKDNWEERQAFKDTTRLIRDEGSKNSDFVERGDPESFGQEDEDTKKENFLKKWLSKGKGKGRQR
jgi:hypothetical protein